MSVHVSHEAFEAGAGVFRALRHTGVSIFYQDPELRILWAENVPRAWAQGDVSGLTDADFLPDEAAGRLITAKRAVLRSGRMETLEIHIPDRHGTRWFDVWIDADRQDEAVAGIVTTAVETTEQKRREQTLRALLREVSHRSKNLLAIIQSVATQTGRYSDSLDGFLLRFRGRLQSLASSQDLVTMSNWRGADLRELVVGQVGRYCADAKRNLQVEGENPYLNPNAALHIGLALHELAINSVSFGALSKPDGVVTVSARIGPIEDGREAMTFSWAETVEPRSEGFKEKRFGSVALERVVPASLNGTSRLAIDGPRLEYALVVPRGNFESD